MQCNRPCSRFFNRLLPCCPAAPAVASWAITWCTKRPKELLPLYLRQHQCIKAQSSRSFPVRNRPTGPASVRFPIHRHRVQHTDSHIFYRLVYTIVTHGRTQQDTFSGESDGWHFTSTFCLLHLVFFFLFLFGRLFLLTFFFLSAQQQPLLLFLPFFCFMRSTWRCVAARAWSAGIGIEQGRGGGVDVTHYAARAEGKISVL